MFVFFVAYFEMIFWTYFNAGKMVFIAKYQWDLKYLLKVKFSPNINFHCPVKSNIFVSVITTWKIWFGNMRGKKKKVCCNKKTNSKPFKIKTKQKINAKTRNKIKKKKKRVRKSQRWQYNTMHVFVWRISAAFLFIEEETECCSRWLQTHIYLWNFFCLWKSQDKLRKRHQNVLMKYIGM